MQCIVCSVLWAVYRLHCKVCTVQWALYSGHYTVFTLQCALYSVLCTLCSVHCVVYRQCAVYIQHLLFISKQGFWYFIQEQFILISVYILSILDLITCLLSPLSLEKEAGLLCLAASVRCALQKAIGAPGPAMLRPGGTDSSSFIKGQVCLWDSAEQ